MAYVGDQFLGSPLKGSLELGKAETCQNANYESEYADKC